MSITAGQTKFWTSVGAPGLRPTQTNWVRSWVNAYNFALMTALERPYFFLRPWSLVSPGWHFRKPVLTISAENNLRFGSPFGGSS